MVERDLLFEDILDSITSHVAVLDDSGRIIAVNSAWKSFARENGCTDENSYLGVDYLSVCEAAFRHDNDESAIAALWGILEVLEGPRTAFSLEYPCHSPERKRWFVMRASRMRRMQRGVVIAHDDITPRRLAEEALQKSREDFRAIADYTVDWESWITPDGRLVWVNPAVERLTGYSVDDCMAMPGYPLPIIVEEDLAFMRQKLQEAIQGSRADGVEFRIAHKDGTVSWGEISWQPIFDQQSHPLGYRSSVRDITERKQAEQAMRESEARLRAIFEHSMVGILFTAPDGRIFAANPAACRMFGRTEEEIIKIGRASLVDRKDPHLKALLSEREKKGYIAGELTHLRADGTRFPTQVSSVVFETAEGPRTCIVIHDISEWKLAEESIHNFSQGLLSVREEEKRHISSALHHDVGSITVGVMARLHAAEEDLRSGKYKDALESLTQSRRLFEKSLKQLKALATDLRPPDLDILGLPTALRQHIDQITHKIPVKIRFTDTIRGTTIPPGIQTVFFRIVQECLNNVIKHAQAKHVRVRLSAPKQHLQLSIMDDGKGFDQSRQALKPGTNLGLQAMQEMIAGLDGVLSISSTPGKGVKVTVTIPTDRETSKWKEPQ